MSIVAIIPARGGSKRIPRKNIKDFCGKPMISYAIQAAKESGVFDTIMVSTDDEEIVSISLEFGAKVPFIRSKETSSDFATTYDVLEEVLNEFLKIGNKYDEICCLYPCVPLLKGNVLHEAYNQWHESGLDSMISTCVFPAPIEWAMNITNSMLKPVNREMLNVRSQDLTPKYFDAGMFYFCKTESLLLEKSLVTNKTGAYIMNEMNCQDIDTINDWKTAEIKYRVLEGLKNE